MKKDYKSNETILRQKAETLLKKIALKTGSKLSETETAKLIYELGVHQLELELQNEELLIAKMEAEVAVRKYSELYDFAPSGFFTLSRDGQIMELNLRGANILGETRAHLKNSHLGFFISDDTLPIFNRFLERVFNSTKKETCEVILATGNLPIYVQLEGIITVNREQCLLTVVDISELKQNVTLLEISNRQKSLILEASGEGILGFDLAGNHTFINPVAVKLLGYDAEELLGKESHSIYHHHHPDGTTFPANTCPIRQTYLAGKPHFGEDYFWRKDGTGFPVEFSSLPITDNFRIIGAVVSFRDISRRKKGEEELLEKINELQRFNNLTVGRELTMIELKKEVNELLEQLGRDQKYSITG